MPAPNLIERMENLIAALEDASEEILNSVNVLNTGQQAAIARIDDAGGIAGEILTMIDGR